MIRTLRHKGLKRFFEDGDSSKLRQDLVERIAILLAALDEAPAIRAMDRPGFRLHPLKGDLAGYWAVVVRANWRIVFHFEDATVADVDLVDYH